MEITKRLNKTTSRDPSEKWSTNQNEAHVSNRWYKFEPLITNQRLGSSINNTFNNPYYKRSINQMQVCESKFSKNKSKPFNLNQWSRYIDPFKKLEDRYTHHAINRRKYGRRKAST